MIENEKKAPDGTTAAEASSLPAPPVQLVPALRASFEKTVWRAQAVLFVERLWPRALPLACTGGFFLSASWAGLWGALPPYGRMAGVAVFAASAAFSPFLFRTGSLRVSRRDALNRIDELAVRTEGSGAGKLHDGALRPAAAIDDSLARGGAEKDGVSAALWNARTAGLLTRWAGRLEPGTPRPGMAARDPYAVRFLAGLFMAATAVAGSGKVADAFDWDVPLPPVKIRAWVTPPDYIGGRMPVLYLTQDGTRTDAPAVVAGSVLTVISAGGPLDLVRDGGPVPAPELLGAGTERAARYDMKLTASDSCIAAGNGPRWCFSVTEDRPPSVEIGTVKPDERRPSSLSLTCTARDDFGISGTEAVIEPSAPAAPGARPLPQVRSLSIPLPGGPGACRPE